MKTRLRSSIYTSTLLVFGVLLASGCSRISNPLGQTTVEKSGLPINTIHEVALYFEEQVREGNRSPELVDRPDLMINSPAIVQVLRSRAARSELIKELLDSGDMLEQSNSKIAIIRSDAYKKKGDRNSRDRNALIVISENVDRVTLYDALRKSNGFPPTTREVIEKIFFDARISGLETGQKYHGADNEILVR